MTQEANDIKLGRFLSLVLRHRPSAAGITLDAHGWADVDELLSGVRRTGRRIDMDTLERIVQENNKRRYSFNEDHTKIRANQGHSIPVDVELKKETPPRRQIKDRAIASASMMITTGAPRRRPTSSAV